MKHFKRATIYVCIIGFMVIVLLVGYGLFGGVSFHVPYQEAAPVVRRPGCGLADSSFCQTEGELRSYVKVNDFSDVLESQVPTPVTCGGGSPLENYCQDGQTGLTIQLFQVQHPSGMGYMTRNQYITYFAAYEIQHGPFNFTGASANGNTAEMRFSGTSSSYGYVLVLSKKASQWKVLYPIINS